jgi:hypothetical protein
MGIKELGIEAGAADPPNESVKRIRRIQMNDLEAAVGSANIT